jgi:hypothetical protein
MPKQIENTSAAQPLNKARWIQALDQLEREYLAFQTSSVNTNSVNTKSTQHSVRTSSAGA